MGSGPILAMVWEGRDAVKTGRCKYHLPPSLPLLPKKRILTNFETALLGATNPLASLPGTIRGDYAIDVPNPNLLIDIKYN